MLRSASTWERTGPNERKARQAMDRMLAMYIRTALWSSTDESRPNGGDPLDDNYTADDIAPDTLARMREDCERFARENEATIVAVLGHEPRGAREAISWASIGHDLWLNRNGHGAGFWDGDYPEPQASALDRAAKRMGERHLYVGDDGKIHQDG